jgi:hypothetical protein
MNNSELTDITLQRLQTILSREYQILGLIGRGGMGEVYKAQHKLLHGMWAIKVLSQELSRVPALVERFLTEARLEAELLHPNIVQVVDVDQREGLYYLRMRYIEGEDLDERLKRLGRLEPSNTISIALQVSKALEYAHDKKVIHRDLKPSNIRIDSAGTAFVIDFGIARVRDASLLRTTQVGDGATLGTPLYMSPEQLAGRSADERADLYALGVIMYEMLIGESPFAASEGSEIKERIRTYQPPSVSSIRSDVPIKLSEIIERLMAKDPGVRYQRARKLKEELTALQPDALLLTPTPVPKPGRRIRQVELTSEIPPPGAQQPATPATPEPFLRTPAEIAKPEGRLISRPLTPPMAEPTPMPTAATPPPRPPRMAAGHRLTPAAMVPQPDPQKISEQEVAPPVEPPPPPPSPEVLEPIQPAESSDMQAAPIEEPVYASAPVEAAPPPVPYEEPPVGQDAIAPMEQEITSPPPYSPPYSNEALQADSAPQTNDSATANPAPYYPQEAISTEPPRKAGRLIKQINPADIIEEREAAPLERQIAQEHPEKRREHPQRILQLNLDRPATPPPRPEPAPRRNDRVQGSILNLDNAAPQQAPAPRQAGYRHQLKQEKASHSHRTRASIPPAAKPLLIVIIIAIIAAVIFLLVRTGSSEEKLKTRTPQVMSQKASQRYSYSFLNDFEKTQREMFSCGKCGRL